MSVRRGDVVIVNRPFASGSGRKPRPALVVQNDLDNQRLVNTILAMITSMTKRALEPTQYLIEINTQEGQRSGLLQDSVVNCINLMTVEQNRVLNTIGDLSLPVMQQINDCLRVALELT